GIAHDLLVSLPAREVRLSLTTRCNLRCVYCAVSQSTYQGSDMTADVAHQATAAILRIALEHKLRAVHVNGHGETTFVPGWVDGMTRTVWSSRISPDLPSASASPASVSGTSASGIMRAFRISSRTCLSAIASMRSMT